MSALLPNKPLVPTRNGEAPLLAAQRRRWASLVRSRVVTIVLLLLAGAAWAGDINLDDPAVPERLELAKPDWTEVRALLERRTAEGYRILTLYWNSSERWVEAKATTKADRKAGAYFFYRKFKGHWYEVDEAVSWKE